MSTQPVPITLPPHLFCPVDGIDFNNHAYINLPAIGATSDVVSFTVPQGWNGVIRKIANVYVGSGFVEGSGSVVWQILADKGVVRNYDNIVASLGATNNPSEVCILIYEQQLIELNVKNVSLNVGGAQIGGRLYGWFYPKVMAPELRSGIWS